MADCRADWAVMRWAREQSQYKPLLQAFLRDSACKFPTSTGTNLVAGRVLSWDGARSFLAPSQSWKHSSHISGQDHAEWHASPVSHCISLLELAVEVFVA